MSVDEATTSLNYCHDKQRKGTHIPTLEVKEEVSLRVYTYKEYDLASGKDYLPCTGENYLPCRRKRNSCAFADLSLV